MTTLYKLTDKTGKTKNNTQWGPGVSHSGTGEGDLCGPGWIHAYTHPLLAVLLDPVHANFSEYQLWEAEGEIAKVDHGMKVGCATLRTIRLIEIPKITTVQRAIFAILCAMEINKDKTFCDWADNWLNGKNRSAGAAAIASAALEAALDAVGLEAASLEAATWATWAAEAAALEAAAARSMRVEWKTQTHAAQAAQSVARAASRAAQWMAIAAKVPFDLIAIAQRAVSEP